MNKVAGLLLASGFVLGVPAQEFIRSPHDAAGVGALGLIGRGVTPEERPAVVGVPPSRLAPVYVLQPPIAPSRPGPVATSTAPAAGREGSSARSSASEGAAVVGDRGPARRPALARANPYLRYDRGWLHGYWKIPLARTSARRAAAAVMPGRPARARLGASGGGRGTRRLAAALGARPGLGSGWGLSAWLIGPMVYRWGYLHYDNPFLEGQGPGGPRGPSGCDYSQPVNVLGSPPPEAVLRDALAGFRAAREAFRREEYTRALQLADESVERLPNDPSIHEFRGLTLLALHRYGEAAAALHAATAVVPGWDWPTLLNLYGTPETYARQLRLLETYCEKNPRSTAGHFLLAVQYLSTGYADAAVGQLREAAALRPDDSLIARLIRALQGPEPGAATPVAAGPGEPGNLEGTWIARTREGTAITLVIPPRGRWTWRLRKRGQEREYQASGLLIDGVLTVTEDPDNAMAGGVTWRDPRHFTFEILEGEPDDPGLSFAKSS